MNLKLSPFFTYTSKKNFMQKKNSCDVIVRSCGQINRKLKLKKNYFFQISTDKNIFYIYNNSKNPMKT